MPRSGIAIGTDGMVWGSVLGFPGGVVAFSNPGSNPPETALAEYYEVPESCNVPNPKAPVSGFRRAADIDRNNVVWVALGKGI